MQEAARIASGSGVPVWFEPVSAPKSRRAAAALPLLRYISPNAEELRAMAEALAPLPGQAHARARSGMAGIAGPGSQTQIALAGGGLSDEARIAIKQLLPHLGTVLTAGVECVVLTLGHLGATLCRLRCA